MDIYKKGGVMGVMEPIKKRGRGCMIFLDWW
jgi:hypothetical protein